MTVRLYLAPAGAGKTAYVLNLAREAARDLQVEARVCLPTHLQAQAWRLRLALAGGAMGVRVMTFDQLYVACLQAAGKSYAELSEPVQYRLIRSILERLPLDYYAALTGLPGFIQVIQDFIG
jgi:ATP-dependent helicase/DNAse subunit B